MSYPAIFLDRDGVINADYGYVHKPEQVEFLPGIFELVRLANNMNYKVIIVTNQAGIGRGYYTLDDFEYLMTWMRGQFLSKGAIIDEVYYCPYHPTHGIGKYRKESYYRKPSPGMLLKAKRKHNIDMQSSILIGDKMSDIEAGLSAGVGILIHYGGKSTLKGVYNFDLLSDIVNFISNLQFALGLSASD